MYTRVLDANPTMGRMYHHRGVLAHPDYLQRLFNYTKALVVDEPHYPAAYGLFNILMDFASPGNLYASNANAEALSVDKHNLLTGVAHLILANQRPEVRQEHGYNTSTGNHFHVCARACMKMTRPDPTPPGLKFDVRPRYVPVSRRKR